MAAVYFLGKRGYLSAAARTGYKTGGLEWIGCFCSEA
jgi:hypothetical protein